jgi:hypothetical protein
VITQFRFWSHISISWATELLVLWITIANFSWMWRCISSLMSLLHWEATCFFPSWCTSTLIWWSTLQRELDCKARLMCLVSLSGLSQLSTCTPIWGQQFLAKGHLKNKCLAPFSFCNRHNSQVYVSIYIFFILRRPMVFSLSFRSSKKSTLSIIWHLVLISTCRREWYLSCPSVPV